MKGEEMEEVKVVRCKDCIYAGETLIHGIPKMVCNKRVVGYVKPDFYCADGEEGKFDASKESFYKSRVIKTS